MVAMTKYVMKIRTLMPFKKPNLYMLSHYKQFTGIYYQAA